MAAKPYDPINSIEGMFNGCITRIAQAIKDPVNFGPSTKGVLLECSKRFQDALDDCEIQILDAKFYLEHQLAQNKVRREAKAKEETVASAKRKHDEIKDKDTEGQADNAKRVKVEDSKPAEPEQPLEPPQAPESEERAAPTDQKPSPPNPKITPTPTPTPIPKPKEKEASIPPDIPSKDDKAKPKDKDKDKEKPADDAPGPLTTPLDEFPKGTPNATPAPTNDDFNFESMFGEPSGDVTNSADLTFDLDLDALDPSGMGNLDTSNDPTQDQEGDLTSLLPGLESYANQASDDPSGLAVGMADQSGGGMNFGLPNLEPNEFDAFLDANDFGSGGGGGAGDGSFKMDDAMNMNPESMENVDFDSMFN